MNWTESTLRAWEPRSPSPELRGKIFGAKTPAADQGAFDFGPLWSRWAAPAIGCFALVAGITQARLGTEASPLAPRSATQGLDHSQMNSIPLTRVEWAFGAEERPAAAAPALLLATNFINR